MKALTAQQYARALYEAVQETAPKDHEKVLDNFVEVLVQNGAVGMYDDIESEYRSLDLAAKGVQQVSVTTTHDVKSDHQLVLDLNRLIGSKLEVSKRVDDRLLGGVVIRAGDTLVDASLAKQLARLAKEMET